MLRGQSAVRTSPYLDPLGFLGLDVRQAKISIRGISCCGCSSIILTSESIESCLAACGDLTEARKFFAAGSFV